MTNTVSRLSASNAAYNWMNAANARMNLAFRGGSASYASLLSADKNLALDMLNDSFKYKAYTALADSQDKIQKENIKRSFSIFA